MQKNIANKNCILIIDDDFINRELLKNIFSSQYSFEEAEDGVEGLEQISKFKDKLCAIILDVQMPKLSGIEVLKKMSIEGITEEIPTFLITAQDDDDIVNEAYMLGVVDVVPKPVTPIIIQKRVQMVIELFSARESLSAKVKGQEEKLIESAKIMDELNRGTIETLATAIEFRDIESGQHVNRIYGITKYILTNTAFGMGLSEDDIENIARGAIMHDVGKIAISDVILNKPGKLTKEEFEIMKGHTVKGYELLNQICQLQLHKSYQYAADIARHHHERWDGRGYPDGLKGDEISVAAQVVSIVDVYDALVSERVYKKAYTSKEAVKMIKNGECGVFNPRLVECFLEVEPIISQWYLDEEGDDYKKLMEEDVSAQSSYNTSNTVTEDYSFNSVADVMLLITAMQTAYDAIVSVNLTKNTFHMMDSDRFLTHGSAPDGVYDNIIELGCTTIPVSHRREFRQTFSRQSLLNAYASGKKIVRLEYPQYSDDGVIHWLNTKALLMKDERTGDILEMSLFQYIDEEYAEREKTRKILSDALSLAEQANNAKYDFLSKMSHDIRTPLNAIIGMTTIIAANLENKNKINDCLIKIGASSRYLLGIINDILDYSKIENGSLSINLSDFSLRDLISEIEDQAKPIARTKKQKFSVEVDENLCTSYIGDEYRIRQVITNLLDNAHRYTNVEGAYSLKVSVSRTAYDHDVITFVVEDNGVGIRSEFLERIFEPFAQDDNADVQHSIGLGLPIAKTLAHLMNGDIVVKSQEGVGSIFTFEIPMERGNLTPHEQSIDTDINVLIVDDDMSICEHTSILLHNMGILAQMTDNGEEAIRLVKLYHGTENEFDVAIIDWKMPKMDGVETVKHIRKIVGNDVLVVVMSAFDWTEIEEEARAAGVDLFITKPISEVSLRTAIACSEKIKREQKEITFEGQKVLVVEDNEFNAEVAKAILEMKNLKVDLAPNGKVAYDMFVSSKEGEYLAIFMDVIMPVMNGHEATRAIRASSHPNAKDVAIYAMTANTFHNDVLQAKLAGMNGHIAKPVDFEEVARTLYGLLKD